MLKLTTDKHKHKASRGLSATVELLVIFELRQNLSSFLLHLFESFNVNFSVEGPD